MNIAQTLDYHLGNGNYKDFMDALNREYYGSGFNSHLDVVDGDHYKSISGNGGDGYGISKESPDEKPTGVEFGSKAYQGEVVKSTETPVYRPGQSR